MAARAGTTESGGYLRLNPTASLQVGPFRLILAGFRQYQGDFGLFLGFMKGIRKGFVRDLHRISQGSKDFLTDLFLNAFPLKL